MGLTIAVGLLADEINAGEDGDTEFLQENLERLNSVLKRAGLSPHHEPIEIAQNETFSADLIGYNGLHMVRRLAAYRTLADVLPTPIPYSSEEDPEASTYYKLHKSYCAKPPNGFLAKLFGARPSKPVRPPFRHLMFHSDAEGFYVPQAFEDVIFAHDNPNDGLGGMVGSSYGLLEECLQLAAGISLPANFDPEAHDLEDAINGRGGAYQGANGQTWGLYPVEAYCLGQLILGCQASIKNKAVLAFC
jgi:hypothetical protein